MSETPDNAVFGPCLGQLAETIKLTVKSFWLLFKLSLILLFIGLLWEIFTAAISPDYSIEALFAPLQERMDAASKLEEFGGEGADWDKLKDGFSPNEGPNPVKSPIATFLAVIGAIAIWFLSYIASIFVAYKVTRENQVPTVAGVYEAIVTCPGRFYWAAIKKWLWVAGPFLIMLIAVPFSFVSGVLGGVAVGLTFIVALCWSLYRGFAFMFIEFNVLLNGMVFKEAREASYAVIRGKMWPVGFAFLIYMLVLFIIFFVVIFIAVIIFFVVALLMIAMMNIGAFFILIPVAYVGFALYQFIPVFLGTCWTFLIWENVLRPQYEARNNTLS